MSDRPDLDAMLAGMTPENVFFERANNKIAGAHLNLVAYERTGKETLLEGVDRSKREFYEIFDYLSGKNESKTQHIPDGKITETVIAQFEAFRDEDWRDPARMKTIRDYIVDIKKS